jgi:diguanylate cyclase (GGDEF)-like protein
MRSASAQSGSIPSVSSEDELERAVDALAGVVRSYGENAFDTDASSANDTSEACLAMARTLTLGPTRNGASDPPPPSIRRDFGSVRRFVEQHRREERTYVLRSSTNLRQTVQAFAQCLTATMTEDQEGDRRVEMELTRLVEVVTRGAPDELERQLGALVSLVRSTIDRRREREVKQRQHLGKRVLELKAELDNARSQATRDPLTQLFNRAALSEELERVTALGAFLSQEPCLLIVDVDHFKGINDRFGHNTGDQMLKAVADNIARHFMRREDLVARYGGEEFAVLVCDSTLERSVQRAERLREAQRKLEVTTASGPLSVTLSIGVAPLTKGETSEAWIERADQALYTAKRAGRDRTEVAPPNSGVR